MRSFPLILLVALVALAGCKQKQAAVEEEEGMPSDTIMAPDTAARAEAVETGPGHEAPETDEEIIDNATSAAPEAVAKEAKVVALDAQGQMRTVREGSGPFTCMADNPGTPGNDPMCLDANGMKWLQAYLTKSDPPPGEVGFGYMLKGGSDASNTDPYATEPAPGQDWIDTGPHVMIFGATDEMTGYPNQAGDPSKPYVMWPGTPYRHVMVPVR